MTSVLWRRAGEKVAADGLPSDLPNRAEMIAAVGVYAAAVQQAQFERAEVSRVLYPLLGLDPVVAAVWEFLSEVERRVVVSVVESSWRLVAEEADRIRREQVKRDRESVCVEGWQAARRDVARLLADENGTAVLCGDDGRELGFGPVTEAVTQAVMEAQYVEFTTV